MSDYRDPRDPVYRDPLYGNLQEASRLRGEAYGSGMIWVWLLGIVAVMGILIYAFGSGDGTQTAQFESPPPATAPTNPNPGGPAQ